MKKTIFVGWWQVAVCMLNQAVASGTIIICFSVIAVPLQKEFAPSRTVLMLIMTVTYLINGLVNPVLGAAMDRYSIRKILMGGGVFLAAGYFALSLSTSMVHVFLAYGVFLSLANAILGPLSYSTLLPRWFVRKRARAVGMTVLGYALGGLFLPPIFQLLIDAFGWRAAVRLFAAFVIVFVIPVIGWLIVDRPSDVGLYPDGDTQPPPASVSESTPQQESTTSLLRDMNFWVITLAVGLVVCGAAGVLGNMVPFVISRGFTAAKGALVLSCFSAGSFSSKLLYAAFGDRLRPRIGLAGGLFLFTLSCFFFLSSHAYSVLLIGSFLHGTAVGVALPLWSYLTARVFGSRNVGRIFGLMTIVVTPISLLAPPVLGLIYDLTGAYDYGFILYIFLAFFAFLLVSRLRIDKQPQIASAVPLIGPNIGARR
jgi:MFS family permease